MSDSRSKSSTEKVRQQGKLFISNIDHKASYDEIEKDLHKIFEQFGKLRDVIIKKNQKCGYYYAFLQYQSPSHAKQAMTKMDGHQLYGKPIKIQRCHGGRRKYRDDSCFTCHRRGHYARQCPQNRRGFYLKLGYYQRMRRSRSRQYDSNFKRRNRPSYQRDKRKNYHYRSSSRSNKNKHDWRNDRRRSRDRSYQRSRRSSNSKKSSSYSK